MGQVIKEGLNFAKLKLVDSSLEVVQENAPTEEILLVGMTRPEELKNNHLVFIKNKKFFLKLKESLEAMGADAAEDLKGIAVIIDKKFYQIINFIKHPSLVAVFTTENVNNSVALLSRPFFDLKYQGVDLTAAGSKDSTSIHPSAKIANGVFIGQGVVVEENVVIMSGAAVMANSKIAANTTLFSNVTIYPFVSVGKNCRIHAGTVIGADGFGYNFSSGVHHKIWHMGGVTIEDNVEIGANTAIDCGTFNPTVIGAGTKIDNFVQIGHNCTLGKGVILCGHTGISGSTTIGDFCVFGGHSGCGPDLNLGNQCQVAGGALVNCDWPAKSVVAGHPARKLNEWLRGVAYIRKESANTKKEQNNN